MSNKSFSKSLKNPLKSYQKTFKNIQKTFFKKTEKPLDFSRKW